MRARSVVYSIAAAMVLAVPAWPQSQVVDRSISGTTLDSRLTAAVSRGDVPGVVAIAATRDRILYTGTFGMADKGLGRPMTSDAIFRIASMTKPVTSVALMQLVEQGRIALDDPADRFLPEFSQLHVFDAFDGATGAYKLHPAASKVTIRQLLTHTSGLGYGFTSATVRDFKPRDGERYPVGPLLFEPGTNWCYGTSVDWVGRLVETISGQSLEDYFRVHVFTPLKMPDTFFNVPEGKQPRLVTVHTRENGRGDAPLVEQPNRPQRPTTSFNGGGGLSSTAADYMRFAQMFLNGGTLDGARILSRDTVALMSRNHIQSVSAHALKTAEPVRSMDFTFIDEGRDKWGLGFLITSRHVPGKRAAGSLSWGGIDNTYFWIDPDRGVAGVIMMQLLPFADTKALAVYDTFERGVYELLDSSKKR
jgi:CubicO group peptidase (beta-lactamase class C family)